MHARSLAAVALGALTLTACSLNDESPEPAPTSTVTATTMAPAPAPHTTEATTGTPTEESSISAAPTATTTTRLPGFGPTPPYPGDFNGLPVTICIEGNGYGTTVWAGNENTSCEFVVETHKVLVEGLNATSDNIRDTMPRTITVHSPVTQQDYQLECSDTPSSVYQCVGGNNAAVYFF